MNVMTISMPVTRMFDGRVGGGGGEGVRAVALGCRVVRGLTLPINFESFQVSISCILRF